jgi:nitrogen fixation-related uncharacterized protein
MNRKKMPIWIFGVSVGLLLFGLGFYTGQYEDIYRKAIMICLECIGIG